MVRTKEEVITEINTKFKCLFAQQTLHNEELQALKIKLLRELSKIDEQSWINIDNICQPFIPKDANSLLQNMSINNYCADGVTTEDQVSTLLICLLTPEVNLTEDELAFCEHFPDPIIQKFINYISNR